MEGRTARWPWGGIGPFGTPAVRNCPGEGLSEGTVHEGTGCSRRNRSKGGLREARKGSSGSGESPGRGAGQVSSVVSKDGVVEVTRPIPEGPVGTIVQKATTRDPLTTGFLLQREVSRAPC